MWLYGETDVTCPHAFSLCTLCKECTVNTHIFTYCIWHLHFQHNPQYTDTLLDDWKHCRKHFLHTSSGNKDHHKSLSQGCSSDCLDTDHQTHMLDVHLLKQNDSRQLLSQQTIMLFFMFHLMLKVFNFPVPFSRYELHMTTHTSENINAYNIRNIKTQFSLFLSLLWIVANLLFNQVLKLWETILWYTHHDHSVS
jgi:hypothetical protein